MATRQYVGARYVPTFGGEWNQALPYEALTIVTVNGNSFTSKKPVPAGTEIGNTEYWASTGIYSAQIEQYRQQVELLKADEAARSRYTNRKIVILGASNEAPAGVGGVTPWTIYFKKLVEVFGATVYNKAVGGASLIKSGDHWSLLQEAQYDKANTVGDMYVICLPSNDFIYQFVDPIEYLEQFNALVTEIRSQYVAAEIYVCPSAIQSWTTTPATDLANSLGFVYAMVKARCDALGICFVPQQSRIPGLQPGVNHTAFTQTDGLHFNQTVTPFIAKNTFNAIAAGVHGDMGHAIWAFATKAMMSKLFTESMLGASGYTSLEYIGGNTINVKATVVFNADYTASSGGTLQLATKDSLISRLSPAKNGTFLNGKIIGSVLTVNCWTDPNTGLRLNAASGTKVSASAALNLWGALSVDPGIIIG